MNAMPSKAWAEMIHAIQRDSGGCIEIAVITLEDRLSLSLAALAGDPDAMLLHRAMLVAIRNITKAPRKRPQLCVSCPRPLGKALACSFAVALPRRDDPAGAIGMAVCRWCAITPAEVEAKATEWLRRLWPDLRQVAPVTHPEGGQA